MLNEKIKSWLAQNWIIIVFALLFVGVSVGWTVDRVALVGELGRANQGLADLRADYDGAIVTNRQLEAKNSELGGTIASLTGVLSTARDAARGIDQAIERAGSTAGNVAAKLRAIIAALIEIRNGLEPIANLGSDTRNIGVGTGNQPNNLTLDR